MPLKKILFIITLFCICSVKLIAQDNTYQVSGILQGEDGFPIDYSEVSATDSTNVVVQRVLTDSIGVFNLNLKKGFYKLSSNRYGSVLFEEDINVMDNMNLGIITVNSATVLEGITITSTKKLIERKVDRFVFNIENSPLLSGGNAFDAIKNAPGVYLGNNESINIMGKSGVKVMVDDRVLNLNPNELTAFLKSMGADNIKSLEVITTPSSKYDAQGNAGIINIITKKGRQHGWNANVGLTGYQGKYSRLIGNAGFNYKSDRIDFISNYAVGDVRSFEEIEQTNSFVNPNSGDITKYSSLNYEKRKEVYHTLTGQLDVKLSEYSNIGISGNLYSNNSPRPSDNETESTNNTSFASYNDHKLNLLNYAIDLYFNQKLDTLGKVMNVNASISNFKVDDKQNLTNRFYTNQVFEDESKLRSFFDNKTKIYSGNIDFKLPYDKFTLETGIKMAHTETENDFLFQNFLSGQWENNNSLSNQFDYKETNTAGYFSFNSQLSDQMSFQVGLRGEYTRTKGLSRTTGTETDYNYFQLFPTAYFQYKPDEKNYSLNLSYSRRISRPSFDYLNPFISYQSPLFSNVGNPLLRPSFTNSLEISSIFNNKYILTIFGNTTSKYFSEFPIRVNNTDETRYTFDNIGKGNNIGIQAIVPVKVTPWWDISNTFLVMNQNYNLSHEDIQQKLNKVFWLINTSNTFKINENISAELSGRYRSPSIQGFYQIGNFFDMSTAINVKLLQDKATLSFSAHDLLYTNRSIVNIQYPNQDLGFTRYNDTRLFKLSFRYKFGNTDLKNKQKQQSGSIEEQNRAGK
ncbi:TonB-dependent receptor [Elizabethkingia argentiflava]|uniref:TonB-dependent receptor n=1 Tax=Elizabethkingia argenteiflava TaxID=2681556 RepID=A0A845PVJ5_9FLAO|nr:outer membrane beta-barrel family protein [Elizabethkingia argenteiflava]NAW50497.1 TonB-dependent receptor [Elizabethkingia argenteiflava]